MTLPVHSAGRLHKLAVSCINRSDPFVLVGMIAAGLLAFGATNVEGLVEVNRVRRPSNWSRLVSRSRRRIW